MHARSHDAVSFDCFGTLLSVDRASRFVSKFDLGTLGIDVADTFKRSDDETAHSPDQ